MTIPPLVPPPSSPPPLKFADLFCGIGGFHQALASLGMSCVYACDNNPFVPPPPNYATSCPFLSTTFPRDITQVVAADIPDCDVLCAGFPCQPFSLVGRKRGFADPSKGNLFFDLMRIVDGKRPAVLFLENVRNLLHHDQGRTFHVIEREITRRGYSWAFQIIKATDFNLPQHRPRVYLICFDKLQVSAWDSFVFPDPVPLTTTMSDIWGAPCSRAVGFTLRVGGRGSPLTDRRNWDGYLVNGHERRLTPREGKRMMGFPDAFLFPGSPRQALKQLGNAVAVPVVRALGVEIQRTLVASASRVPSPLASPRENFCPPVPEHCEDFPGAPLTPVSEPAPFL